MSSDSRLSFCSRANCGQGMLVRELSSGGNETEKFLYSMDCCALPSRIHRQIWLRLGTIHLNLVRCHHYNLFLRKSLCEVLTIRLPTCPIFLRPVGRLSILRRMCAVPLRLMAFQLSADISQNGHSFQLSRMSGHRMGIVGPRSSIRGLLTIHRYKHWDDLRC